MFLNYCQEIKYLMEPLRFPTSVVLLFFLKILFVLTFVFGILILLMVLIEPGKVELNEGLLDINGVKKTNDGGNEKSLSENIPDIDLGCDETFELDDDTKPENVSGKSSSGKKVRFNEDIVVIPLSK